MMNIEIIMILMDHHEILLRRIIFLTTINLGLTTRIMKETSFRGSSEGLASTTKKMTKIHLTINS